MDLRALMGGYGRDRRPGEAMSRRFCLAVLVACWPLAGGAADDLRCPGGMVGNGDTAAQVRAACGEPDFVDPWERRDTPPRYAIPARETWVYNPGPGRLIRMLHFREGRLFAVEPDGYGFAVPGPRDCGPNEIAPGMSKYRLLEFCGEPAQRESVILYRPLPPVSFARFTPVRRETWVYNFGRSRFLREVTLENGVVTDVAVGDRGY